MFALFFLRKSNQNLSNVILLYLDFFQKLLWKIQKSFFIKVHSSMCFASGAIAAVKFIAEARENKIYTTREVLGL